MNQHKKFDENPQNSPEYLLELVETKFSNDGEAMLLNKFIKLLGNEKEEWGGKKALEVCMNEFSRWKKRCPELKDKEVSTFKDLEGFLFSPNRYVRIEIQGDLPRTSKTVVDSPENPETLKGPDRPSTSKTVVDPPKNPKTLKGPDSPSTSKAVIQAVVGQTSIPPPITKTLKVKIYMGSGWEIDFKKLNRGSPPNLFVKVTIDGGGSHDTKVNKNTRTPCWGEEFDFRLSSPEDPELKIKVYDYHKISKTKFAGEFCLSVSRLDPGIHVIPLSYEVVMPCSSAWLLVRFMFV